MEGSVRIHNNTLFSGHKSSQYRHEYVCYGARVHLISQVAMPFVICCVLSFGAFIYTVWHENTQVACYFGVVVVVASFIRRECSMIIFVSYRD